MRTRRQTARVVAVLLLAGAWLGELAWGGCAGVVEDPARFAVQPPQCAGVEDKILTQRCGGVACHELSKPAAGLDLASPGKAQRLVGVESSQCRGQLLVDPGAPERSFLLSKLGPDAPACGQRMPLARPALSDDEVACVLTWIRQVTQSDPTSDGGSGAPDADGEVGADDSGAPADADAR